MEENETRFVYINSTTYSKTFLSKLVKFNQYFEQNSNFNFDKEI